MLLAEGILAIRQVMTSRLSPRAGQIVAGVLTVALAAGFAVSASRLPKEFRELTRPYRRFVSAVRRAEVASCGPDVHVVVR
jgi:hypothetical protein